MRISLSQEAQADFDAAIDWYLEQYAFTGAEDFADEFDRALVLLTQFPLLGVTGVFETHTLTLRKFPYSLIYRVFPENIRVIAVAHHSRRPAYWAGRR